MTVTKTNYQLIIFDCDGVLVDSETIGLRVLAQMANEYGLQLSPEEAILRFRGRKIANCISEIKLP